MLMRVTVSIAIISVFMAALLGARPPAMRQAVTCSPLRLRLPEGSVAEQLPPVETFRYTRTLADGRTEELEKFDPEQLWRSEQCLGTWKDRSGNRFELLAPTSRRGDSYAAEHLTREEYDEAQKALGVLRPADLGAWITDWSGVTCERPQVVRPIGAVRQARFAIAGDHAFLIFFLKAEPNRPYVLHINSANEPASAWKGVCEQALGGFAVASSRAIDATAPGKGWITIEKPPYRVYTDLPRKDHRALNRLLGDMQVIRAAYAELFPQPKGRETPLSTIRVFAQKDDYHTYVGEKMEWSVGLFSSTKRELVVLADSKDESNKARREEMRQITFHEGFHQYLFLVTPPKVSVPTWFNEGHATYFDTFRIRSGKAKPTQSYRLEIARKATARRSAKGLAELMASSRESFYDVNRDSAYAVAWLLVHWLRTEAEAPLNTLLDRYYALLCKGVTPAEAQAQLFPESVLKTIAAELDDYLAKESYEP